MPDDLARLHAELDREWHQLWHVEVVEQAERVVRKQLQRLLHDELIGLHEQLQTARHQLAVLGRDDDLQAVVIAEEGVCAVQLEATRLLRRSADELRACEQAEIAFVTRRCEILRRIFRLQRLLGS